MQLKIDLHIHTIYSKDSNITFDALISRCHELGLDGFAVCDHDNFTEIPYRIGEDNDLIIIPSIEVSAKRAHILAYDIDKAIIPNLTIQDTVKQIHMQNGIAVLAHPYSIFRSWVNHSEVIRANFDLIEVANAYQFPYKMMLNFNRKLAEKLNLPMTGGSDAHKVSTIGKVYTIIESKTKDIVGVLQAIRDGKTQPVGMGISLSDRLKMLD